MTPESFERLVRQHKDAVYRQMVRVCSHREDAEDALATALMHAFQSGEQLTSDVAFRSWLGTIGRRVCTRMRANPKIQEAFDVAVENKLLTDETDGFDFQVLKGCVKEAVDTLPDIYRDVYVGCEIEERSVPEVAAGLGLSVAAVKSRLLRARAAVRRTLDSSVCSA